jgi:site-specific DNA recombinase
MHSGLLGTMSQLFLSDLGGKTRRGLEAVVRDGRSAGGLSFGYKLAPAVQGCPGKARRGGRVVDPVQAAVVVRIFEQYAAGVSPKQIALTLNAQGIPGPRGGGWTPSAINGDRRKGTGILNNELYTGQQSWNRRHWVKDPATGKRLARANDAAAVVTLEVPELRIVSDELWQAAKARQALLDRQARLGVADIQGKAAPAPFWSKQRPKYLFSGLMRCGVCDGGFSKISLHHFGCSTARNQGETRCTNLLTIRRAVLEETVLSTLRERLMDPELFRVFAEEFTTEWNRLQAEASAGLTAKRQELARLGPQIERAVDSIIQGTASVALHQRLESLEARKAALEAELAGAEVPAPRLHPALAEVYRARVAKLTAALEADDGAELREQVRALVEAIRLIPEGGKLRVEVHGELGASLRLAEGARNQQRPEAAAIGALLSKSSWMRGHASDYAERPWVANESEDPWKYSSLWAASPLTASSRNKRPVPQCRTSRPSLRKPSKGWRSCPAPAGRAKAASIAA